MKILRYTSEDNRHVDIPKIIDNGGILWFLWISYFQYIDPVGFKKHYHFFKELPFATYRYWKSGRDFAKLNQDKGRAA